MKKITLLLSVCMPLLMMAQTTKVMIGGKPSVFDQRIQGREVVTPEAGSVRLAGDEQKAQWEQRVQKLSEQKQDGRFLSAQQLLAHARAYRAGKVKERMDSTMVREGKNDPNGTPLSKQVFTYDEAGRPLSCINYVPDAETGEWNYYGEYGYEWNDEGHCIAIWAINDPNEGTYKYEYIYGNGGAAYTAMIYYQYVNEEWIPAQMAEYTLDEAGNTIEEVYSAWDDNTSDWVKAQRATATYEEHGWMTSYFLYDWDASKGDWVGRNDATSNMKWEYTATGEDALQERYVWVDGAWLAISRLEQTFDDNNLLTQLEWKYWNFEYQDWRGGYTTQSGQVQNNTKTLYFYDDQKRLVRQESYNRTAEQDYTTYYTYDEIAYTELETGETEGVRSSYANIGAGIELYRRYTSRHKPVATAPTYYLGERKLTAGTDIMIKTEEEYRFIDDDGTYRGLESYSFTPNETNFRQGSSKEEVTYDENGNQNGTHHWRGRRTGATTWVWDDADDWNVYYVEGYDGYVLAGYDRSYYSGTTKYLNDGYITTYDFTMRPENMTKWITANNSEEFRKYKYLETYNFYNQSTVDVDLYEFTNYYYYSQTGKIDGGWNEDGTPTTLASTGGESLKVVQADNGEFYLGWTTTSATGYDANVQLVDVEGYSLLGDEGMKLNTQASSSSISMMGMVTDANNNLIVSYPDPRNETSRWNSKPYVYKVNNTTGLHDWTLDGVKIPSTADGNVMQYIVRNGDNNYVTFSNANDYSAHTYYVNRVNNDGQLAWEESKAMPGAFATLQPSGEGLLMVYSQDKKVYSQVLNADFEADHEATEISGDVEIQALPYTGSLFDIQSDGNGGMFIVFADNSYNAKYYMQHIDATGVPTLTQPYLINPEASIEGLRYCYDADNQQVAFFYTVGDWSGHNLAMQIVNMDGTPVGDEMPISEMSGGYTISGVKAVNGEYILAYVNSIDWSTTEQYVARINTAEGKVYGKKVGDSATSTCTDAIINDDAAYYFWSYYMLDYETYEAVSEIQGVRVLLEDIQDVIFDNSAVVEINADQIQGDGNAYDVMGRRVDPETARGIIIINGKKIIK